MHYGMLGENTYDDSLGVPPISGDTPHVLELQPHAGATITAYRWKVPTCRGRFRSKWSDPKWVAVGSVGCQCQQQSSMPRGHFPTSIDGFVRKCLFKSGKLWSTIKLGGVSISTWWLKKTIFNCPKSSRIIQTSCSSWEKNTCWGIQFASQPRRPAGQRKTSIQVWHTKNPADDGICITGYVLAGGSIYIYIHIYIYMQYTCII